MFWQGAKVTAVLGAATIVALGGIVAGSAASAAIAVGVVGWFGLEVPFSLMMLGFFLFYCLSLIVIGFFGD